MSYFKVNSKKLKKELVDISNLREEIILNFLMDASSIKLNEIPNKIDYKSSNIEFITRQIIKLIKEDFISTEEDFNLNDLDIQYFFNVYNPIIKMSSFSCELKHVNGGAIIYDIVRIGKNKDEYFLFIPDENG